jgi:hypothetical protein
MSSKPSRLQEAGGKQLQHHERTYSVFIRDKLIYESPNIHPRYVFSSGYILAHHLAMADLATASDIILESRRTCLFSRSMVLYVRHDHHQWLSMRET